MNRHRIVSWTLVVLVLPLGLSGRAYAQEKPGMGHGMMTEEQRAEMAARHEQMMTEMETASAQLDSLVAVMKAADGAAKVDAIGAVVAELVAQHWSMHEGMMKMHGHMMGMRMHGEEPAPRCGRTSDAIGHGHRPIGREGAFARRFRAD